MVAIKRYITIALFVTLCVGAHAEGVNVRIAELESDTTYMSLLRSNRDLTLKEDSISHLVTTQREAYLMGGSQSQDLRVEIMQLEGELFELRNRRNSNTTKISSIEQQWILNGGFAPTSTDQQEQKQESEHRAPMLSDDEVSFISQSVVARFKLPEIDLANLMRSERSEADIFALHNRYRAIYEELRTLEQQYNQCESEGEAIEIKTRFDSVARDQYTLADSLSYLWGAVYDDKSFAYNIILELEQSEELLTRGEELSREAAAQALELSQDGDQQDIIRYELQKRALIEFETLIAKELKFSHMVDSLSRARAQLNSVGFNAEYSAVEITLRTFINYEDISYPGQAVYSSSNPIPEAEEYTHGRLYRIQLGAYNSPQSPSTFRGAAPLSYDKTFGFFTYYVGCYATYNEALEAQKACKAKGFRRPEVVLWSDGERRNFSREPLPATMGYRVQIGGEDEFSDAESRCIDRLRGDAELSRIGGNSYILSPFDTIMQAEDLVAALRSVNGERETTIVEIK